MSEPQFVFSDGHWRDAWNGIDDDQPHPNDAYEWWEAVLLRDDCGCVATHLVGDAIAVYLAQPGEILMLTDDGLIGEFVGAWADRLGFTEHGGSIRAAWLTGAGRRWLELYRRSRAERDLTHGIRATTPRDDSRKARQDGAR